MKEQGLKNTFHENNNEKTVDMAVLLSDKINFKTNIDLRDKEDYYIKGLIHQKDMKVKKHKWKWQQGHNINEAKADKTEGRYSQFNNYRDVNSPLSIMNRTRWRSVQKYKTCTTVHHLDLTDLKFSFQQWQNRYFSQEYKENPPEYSRCWATK